jgi:hypothetical protein
MLVADALKSAVPDAIELLREAAQA